jgi:hypothetical protein
LTMLAQNMRRDDTHMAKTIRGRPQDPVETVRSHRIVSYVTGAEIQTLQDIADREGQSLSAIVYEILISALGTSSSEAMRGNSNRSQDLERAASRGEGS